MATAKGHGTGSFAAETRSAGRRGVRSADRGAKVNNFIGGPLQPALAMRREPKLAWGMRQIAGQGMQPSQPLGLQSKGEIRDACQNAAAPRNDRECFCLRHFFFLDDGRLIKRNASRTQSKIATNDNFVVIFT
jgi:hypothetical protein